MIKEIGFTTPVFLSGLVGRPITTWQGAAVATDRGMRLIVPLSAIDTCVPWHNVAWWTETAVPTYMGGVSYNTAPDPARIDVTEPVNRGTADVPDSAAQKVGDQSVSPNAPAPGKGKKR